MKANPVGVREKPIPDGAPDDPDCQYWPQVAADLFHF